MSRRKDYSEENYRSLGVRVRVSHPRLGVKTLELAQDRKQPFLIAAHSLTLQYVQNAINSAFAYERGSKVKLSIGTSETSLDGVEVEDINTLKDHLQGLADDSSKRFQSDEQDATKILKAILIIQTLATDHLNHDILLDKILLSGLVKMCSNKAFSCSVQAARTIKYLLQNTTGIIRDKLLENGAIGGLLLVMRDARFTRGEDEVQLVDVASSLLHEFRRNELETLMRFSSPLLPDNVVNILLQFILRCKRDDTLMIASACACYILPLASTEVQVDFGMKLVFQDDWNTSSIAIYAFALASSNANGRAQFQQQGGKVVFERLAHFAKTLKDGQANKKLSTLYPSPNNMGPKISKVLKPAKMMHVKGVLRPIKASAKQSNEQIGILHVLHELVSRALWGFASALNEHTGEVNFTAEDMPDDAMSTLVSLAQSDSPSIAIGSTGCIANLASAGVFHGQNACFGLIEKLQTATLPIISEYLSTSISSILRQRRSEYEPGEPDEKRKSSDDDKLFKQLVLLIDSRARLGIETNTQIHLSAGIMNMSLPPVSPNRDLNFVGIKTHTPRRSPGGIVALIKLLKYKLGLHPSVLNFLLCALWAASGHPRNSEIIGKAGGIVFLLNIYKSCVVKLRQLENTSTSHATINLLIQRTLGVIYVLSFSKKNQLFLADSTAMSHLLYSLNDENSKSVATTIAVLWKMAESVDCAESMIENGFVSKLLEVVNDSMRPSKARNNAANVLEIMATFSSLSSSFRHRAGKCGETVIEQMLVSMLSDDSFEINAYACKSLARLAMMNRQQVILRLNGIHRLLRVAQRASNETESARPTTPWEPEIVAYQYQRNDLPEGLRRQFPVDKNGVVRITSDKFTKARKTIVQKNISGRNSMPNIRPSSATVAGLPSSDDIQKHRSTSGLHSVRPGTAPTGEQLPSLQHFNFESDNVSKLEVGLSRTRKKKSKFDVMLEPECSHYNRISFGKKAKPNFKPLNQTIEFPGVKLSKFQYVPGNRVSENLFSHYELPDGELTHYYCRSELEKAIDPGPLSILPDAYTWSKVFPGFDDTTNEPLPLLPKPGAPTDEDGIATYIPEVDLAENDERPSKSKIIYVDKLPLLITDEIKVTDISEFAKKEIWTLDKSIFAPRKRMSDAKDYYDNETVKKAAFKIDWSNLMAKKRFQNFIMKEDDDGSKDELYEVRDVIWECYNTIMDAYEFYSVMGTSMSSLFTITLNSYSDFVGDCNIPDAKSKTCKRKDLDTIFIVANVEEDKSSKVNKANDDRALMRFEFLECVVRIAVQKYLRSGDTDDVSDAVRMLCDRNIRPNLGKEAVNDSNDFRRERMYNEAVDMVLKKHNKRLQMIFKVFAQPKIGLTKYQLMNMDEWVYLCKTCELFDSDFTQREGKLAFAWSQMAVADEVRRRVPFTCITFEDFLEAVCRICDMKALPTDDDLLRAGVKTAGKFFHKKKEEGLLDDFCHDNPCHWYEKKDREMGELLPKLLDLMFTKLDRDGDGDFDFSDLQKWVSQGKGR
eukprot:Stramenopile-MAST_4_protein_787